MRKYIITLLMLVFVFSAWASNDCEVFSVIASFIAMGFMILIWVVLGITIYLFFAIGLFRIAQKLGVDNCWFAFIPILNLVLLVECAGKPIWWVLLLFIPPIVIAIKVILWVEIAQKLHRELWWGIVMILVPVTYPVLFGILAYSKQPE